MWSDGLCDPTPIPFSVFWPLDQSFGSMSVDRDGHFAALGMKKGIQLFRFSCGQVNMILRHPREYQYEVGTCQWSPVMQNRIGSAASHTCLVWDIESTRKLVQMLSAHTRAITDLSWNHSNPNVLATCSGDSFIHVWDLRSASVPSSSFSVSISGSALVRWNPKNDYLLASAHEGEIRLWDTRRKGSLPLRCFAAHSHVIYGIDWNPANERQILSCSVDTTVKLWNVDFPFHPEAVFPCHSSVRTVRASPDGVYFAAAHANPSEPVTSLWRLDDCTGPSALLLGHKADAKAVAWRYRPEGHYDFVALGRDQRLALWLNLVGSARGSNVRRERAKEKARERLAAAAGMRAEETVKASVDVDEERAVGAAGQAERFFDAAAEHRRRDGQSRFWGFPEESTSSVVDPVPQDLESIGVGADGSGNVSSTAVQHPALTVVDSRPRAFSDLPHGSFGSEQAVSSSFSEDSRFSSAPTTSPVLTHSHSTTSTPSRYAADALKLTPSKDSKDPLYYDSSLRLTPTRDSVSSSIDSLSSSTAVGEFGRLAGFSAERRSSLSASSVRSLDVRSGEKPPLSATASGASGWSKRGSLSSPFMQDVWSLLAASSGSDSANTASEGGGGGGSISTPSGSQRPAEGLYHTANGRLSEDQGRRSSGGSLGGENGSQRHFEGSSSEGLLTPQAPARKRSRVHLARPRTASSGSSPGRFGGVVSVPEDGEDDDDDNEDERSGGAVVVYATSQPGTPSVGMNEGCDVGGSEWVGSKTRGGGVGKLRPIGTPPTPVSTLTTPPTTPTHKMTKCSPVRGPGRRQPSPSRYGAMRGGKGDGELDIFHSLREDASLRAIRSELSNIQSSYDGVRLSNIDAPNRMCTFSILTKTGQVISLVVMVPGDYPDSPPIFHFGEGTTVDKMTCLRLLARVSACAREVCDRKAPPARKGETNPLDVVYPKAEKDENDGEEDKPLLTECFAAFMAHLGHVALDDDGGLQHLLEPEARAQDDTTKPNRAAETSDELLPCPPLCGAVFSSRGSLIMWTNVPYGGLTEVSQYPTPPNHSILPHSSAVLPHGSSISATGSPALLPIVGPPAVSPHSLGASAVPLALSVPRPAMVKPYLDCLRATDDDVGAAPPTTAPEDMFSFVRPAKVPPTAAGGGTSGLSPHATPTGPNSFSQSPKIAVVPRSYRDLLELRARAESGTPAVGGMRYGSMADQERLSYKVSSEIPDRTPGATAGTWSPWRGTSAIKHHSLRLKSPSHSLPMFSSGGGGHLHALPPSDPSRAGLLSSAAIQDNITRANASEHKNHSDSNGSLSPVGDGDVAATSSAAAAFAAATEDLPTEFFMSPDVLEADVRPWWEDAVRTCSKVKKSPSMSSFETASESPSSPRGASLVDQSVTVTPPDHGGGVSSPMARALGSPDPTSAASAGSGDVPLPQLPDESREMLWAPVVIVDLSQFLPSSWFSRSHEIFSPGDPVRNQRLCRLIGRSDVAKVWELATLSTLRFSADLSMMSPALSPFSRYPMLCTRLVSYDKRLQFYQSAKLAGCSSSLSGASACLPLSQNQHSSFFGLPYPQESSVSTPLEPRLSPRMSPRLSPQWLGGIGQDGDPAVGTVWSVGNVRSSFGLSAVATKVEAKLADMLSTHFAAQYDLVMLATVQCAFPKDLFANSRKSSQNPPPASVGAAEISLEQQFVNSGCLAPGGAAVGGVTEGATTGDTSWGVLHSASPPPPPPPRMRGVILRDACVYEFAQLLSQHAHIQRSVEVLKHVVGTAAPNTESSAESLRMLSVIRQHTVFSQEILCSSCLHYNPTHQLSGSDLVDCDRSRSPRPPQPATPLPERSSPPPAASRSRSLSQSHSQLPAQAQPQILFEPDVHSRPNRLAQVSGQQPKPHSFAQPTTAHVSTAQTSQMTSSRCGTCDASLALQLRCVICELPVKGVMALCSQCHHGGHPGCLEDWFSVSPQCAAGCECVCQAL
eukprot:Rmarinus@m.8653